MQGLARLKLLSQFDYLSTVSGGGYIGGWLTAWAARETDPKNGTPNRLTDIEDQLAQNEPADQGKTSGRSGNEPKPLVELRKNHAFITPKIGLGSADTWAAAAIVIRNVLLNWLVFVPFISSILLIPRVLEWLLVYWAYSAEPGNTLLVAMGYRLKDYFLGGALTQQSSYAVIGHSWHSWLDLFGVFWQL